MLGKLLKYDLKANRNLFLLMYVLLLAVALGSRVSMSNAMDALEGYGGMGIVTAFLMFIYIVALIAISVMAFVLIIRRFYTNLFGSEGYLSFTLPVTAAEHFFSKVISALIWLLCTTLVQIGSLFIVCAGLFDMEYSDYYYDIAGDLFSYKDTVWQTVTGILDVVAGLFMIYFAICLGQMMRRHRVIASVLFYLGLNVVLNFISSVLTETFISVDLFSDSGVFSYGSGYYVLSGLILVIKLALFSTGSIWVMQKKLNLE